MTESGERDERVYDLASRLQGELGDHNSEAAEFRTIRSFIDAAFDAQEEK